MSAEEARTARSMGPDCPVCGRRGEDPFLVHRGVVTQQQFVMPSEARARAVPRGDIELRSCRGCGMIWNAVFDPGRLDYSAPYEASQMLSATFARATEAAVADLVERYRLQGKRVVEIGSGDAGYLRMLCRKGGNSGVGFEPSWPHAADLFADEGIEIVRDRFGPQHAARSGDFVFSRHVLEHVEDPVGFVASLAAAARGGASTIFLEVPSAAWSLRSMAFWDVYYEHCSYFTRPALAEAFERAGMAILRSGDLFGGQYLWVEAGLGTAGARPPPDRDREAAEVADQVQRFAAALPGWREQVAGIFEGARERGDPVPMWGAGAKAVALADLLGITTEVTPFVVDVNPRKWGNHLPGSAIPIVAPEVLRERPAPKVVVLNPEYEDEIRAACRDMGVGAELVVLRAPGESRGPGG